VSHYVKKPGHYENTFTGVVGITETLPDDHVVVPRVFNEPAIVIANDDPKKQGRVKVRFYWQPDDKNTNWIRVQTPDAGKSGVVPTNRGFFFIPEVDDQVMVGYERGDPSRPYVAGSLFHMENSKGAAAENTIKTISTRSGHLIEFDDSGGAWGITIRDINGNIIHLDTKGKNIQITTPESMTLNCKNMYINVEENMQSKIGKDMATSVGKNQQTTVSETIEITSKNMEETYIKEASTTIGKKQTISSGETEHFTNKGDIIIKSARKVLVQGAKDARISKG
jgi:uncharacterized protein involved in type VI secretion and phage assembly